MKKTIRLISCFIIGIIFVIVFSGCSGEKIDVKIKDMSTETQVTVESGKTVEEILSDAEIELADKDITSPGKNEKITKSVSINILRCTTSTVSCDGKTQKLTLTGAKVSDALKKAGIKLSKNDYVNYDQSAYVEDGMKISVVRRLKVKLTADGKTKSYLTKAKTVKGFLKEQNISTKKKDIVTPKLTAQLKQNSKITVKRVTEKKVVITEAIKYSTKRQSSSSLSAGVTKVSVKGVNGSKNVTYKITYIDGKEKNRKKIKETVLKQPVDEVVLQGVKQSAAQSPAKSSGKKIVSKTRVDDCDGSGHGYYIIKYSDGSKKYDKY